jgi:hypothetical protein
MKNLKQSFHLRKIAAIILFFSGCIATAQIALLPEPESTKAVPALVQTAFQQKFPGVEPVWYRRYRGEFDQQLRFQGKFLVNNKTVMAVFNQTGGLMAIVAEMDSREIPKKARKYMENHYPNNTVTQTAKITQVDNVITYELGMYLDNYYVILIFGKNGNFIQLSKG